MGACCGPIHLTIMKENKEIFNVRNIRRKVSFNQINQIFKLLLEKKCDLDLCDEINGNTPIMLATSLNQVNTGCFLKYTFLIVYLYQLETVKRLIKEGADIGLVRIKTLKMKNKNINSRLTGTARLRCTAPRPTGWARSPSCWWRARSTSRPRTRTGRQPSRLPRMSR